MSPFRILVAASLVLAPLAALAQLTPEKVAEIRHAQKAALEKVDAAHGHRKPGEMDNDERRQVIEEQSAAAQSVLDEAGVSAKEYTGYATRMSREEQAAAKAAEQELEARDRARAEKKAAGDEEQAEVQIQQGFSEQDPVELEQREGAGPRVDYGDDAAGQSPESGASSETAESAETAESDGSAPAPTKAKTSRSKGHHGGRGRR